MKRKTWRLRTDQELIEKLVEASKLFGPAISCREIDSLKGFPGKTQFRKYFGTFNRAKELAGLVPNPQDGRWHLNKPGKKMVRKPRVPRTRRTIPGRRSYLSIRFRILERDDFTCQYCGRKPSDGVKLHVDHMNPKINGGNEDMDNLITSCQDCNKGKFDYLLDLNKIKIKSPK